MKNVGIITVIILTMAMGFVVGGLLAYCGWNWFAVEIFPQYGKITFKTAIILSCAKNLLFYRQSKLSPEKSTEEMLKEGLHGILSPLFVLFVFWIAKLIIL